MAELERHSYDIVVGAGGAGLRTATGNDFPASDPEWGKINVIVETDRPGAVTLRRQPLPVMPAELAALLQEQA